MNLQDVITITTGKAIAAKDRKTWMLAKMELEHAVAAQQRWAPNSGDSLKPILDAFDQRLAAAVLSGSQMPARVCASAKGIGAALARAPRTTGASVKALADKVGFLVMPTGYLHEQANNGRGYGRVGDVETAMTSTVRTRDHYGDVREAKHWLQAQCALYVLAPVAFYSASAHMGATEDGEIYAPHDVAQAFMALSMSMPLFRSLRADINSVRDDYHSQQARLSRLETEVSNLQARVGAIQRQIEAERVERVRAETARKEAAGARLMAYDPMLMLLDRKKLLADDAPVFLGPAWGPDFEDHVLPALGLSKVSGQRKLLEANCWR